MAVTDPTTRQATQFFFNLYSTNRSTCHGVGMFVQFVVRTFIMDVHLLLLSCVNGGITA